jgi:hypothetical protein
VRRLASKFRAHRFLYSNVCSGSLYPSLSFFEYLQFPPSRATPWALASLKLIPSADSSPTRLRSSDQSSILKCSAGSLRPRARMPTSPRFHACYFPHPSFSFGGLVSSPLAVSPRPFLRASCTLKLIRLPTRPPKIKLSFRLVLRLHRKSNPYRTGLMDGG